MFGVKNTRGNNPNQICAQFAVVLASSRSVRSRAISGIFDMLGDILDALDLEFGFSRVEFPPKGSKTDDIVVIPVKPGVTNR